MRSFLSICEIRIANVESPLEFNAVQLYTSNKIKMKKKTKKEIMTARIENVNISEAIYFVVRRFTD